MLKSDPAAITRTEMPSASATKKKPRSPARRKQPQRLSVSIIGAGRLGTALAHALKRAGHRVDLVITNHASSARRAALATSVPIAVAFDHLERSNSAIRRLLATDLLLISTPDDAIEPVAKAVAEIFRRQTRRLKPGAKIVFHTSGALSAEILDPLREAGFAAGSLHPLVSVARSASPDIFRNAYFCIEGERRALQVARAIVKQLGGQSFSIASESKPLYHAAAAMSSGHLVALFDLATEMLARCGISRRRAEAILVPLVESTVKNIAANGAAKALTGPLARGDLATVKKHLAAMEAKGLFDAAEIYASIGKRALTLAKDLSANPRQRDRIVKLLTSRQPRL